jgi:PAT family acetyl-CoA transporter-like MFS transporter 1
MPMKLRSRTIDPVKRSGEEEQDLLEESDDEELVMLEKDPEYHGEEDHVVKKRHVKGDLLNILVLLSLYILQGIPLGLAGAVPLILTNRHVSYKEQAEFR